MDREAIEVWKSIPGHDGYEASNFGRIRSLSRSINVKKSNLTVHKRFHKGKILTPKTSTHGYFTVCLFLNGKQSDFFVHELILNTYIGESIHGCNHINGIKKDNRLENLEWANHKENAIHAIKNGLINKTNNNKEFLKKEDIFTIRFFAAKSTMGILAKAYNRGLSTIYKIKNKDTFNFF